MSNLTNTLKAEPISNTNEPGVALAVPSRIARVALVGASQGSVARLAAGLGPRICFSPDEPTAAPVAAPVEPAAAAPVEPAAPAAAPQRPDGIDDQFWDDKTGVKYAELKTHLDELRTVKAAADAKAAAVPEKPDAYELKLPADLTFGEGESFELNPDDPMVAFGREVAHELGADQAAFERIVGKFAQREVATAKELQGLITKQIEALGPKGGERQAAAKNFLTARLGADAAVIFEPVLNLKVGVEKLEGLMKIASGGGGPSLTQTGREGGQESGPTEEEYAAMSPAERLVAARQSRAGGR